MQNDMKMPPKLRPLVPCTPKHYRASSFCSLLPFFFFLWWPEISWSWKAEHVFPVCCQTIWGQSTYSFLFWGADWIFFLVALHSPSLSTITATQKFRARNWVTLVRCVFFMFHQPICWRIYKYDYLFFLSDQFHLLLRPSFKALVIMNNWAVGGAILGSKSYRCVTWCLPPSAGRTMIWQQPYEGREHQYVLVYLLQTWRCHDFFAGPQLVAQIVKAKKRKIERT